MKHIITVLLTFCLVLAVNAQTMIGVRGQATNTWMFNKNIANNGDLMDFKGTFTSGFGITAIHCISETAGIEVGVGTNTIAQRTQGEREAMNDETYEYEAESSVKYLEISIQSPL